MADEMGRPVEYCCPFTLLDQSPLPAGLSGCTSPMLTVTMALTLLGLQLEMSSGYHVVECKLELVEEYSSTMNQSIPWTSSQQKCTPWRCTLYSPGSSSWSTMVCSADESDTNSTCQSFWQSHTQSMFSTMVSWHSLEFSTLSSTLIPNSRGSCRLRLRPAKWSAAATQQSTTITSTFKTTWKLKAWRWLGTPSNMHVTKLSWV